MNDCTYQSVVVIINTTETKFHTFVTHINSQLVAVTMTTSLIPVANSFNWFLIDTFAGLSQNLGIFVSMSVRIRQLY